MCAKQFDNEKTSLRSRLRQAHNEGAKVLANTGNVKNEPEFCKPCRENNHEHCEGVIVERCVPGYSQVYCRCVPCAAKPWIRCPTHGYLEGIAAQTREGHPTIRCPYRHIDNKIVQVQVGWSRSN